MSGFSDSFHLLGATRRMQASLKEISEVDSARKPLMQNVAGTKISPELESQVIRILGVRSALDAPDLSTTEYINRLFPNGIYSTKRASVSPVNIVRRTKPRIRRYDSRKTGEEDERDDVGSGKTYRSTVRAGNERHTRIGSSKEIY